MKPIRKPFNWGAVPASAFQTVFAGAVMFASAMPLAAQTIRTWDGGPLGTGSNISFNANWDNDTLPTSTSSISDTARWNGSPAGNLSLTVSGNFGGGAGMHGVFFDVTSNQTGNLSITGESIIRVRDITIASGAGAVSLPTVQIGGIGSNTTHTITNNSENGLTINELLRSTGGTRGLTITGSGDLTINQAINNANVGDNNFNTTKTGSGTLFLNGGVHETNPWNSTLTIAGGAVRISHGGALGSAGSGTTGVTNINTNAEGQGRLELVGGISVAERIAIRGRNSTDSAQAGVHLLNVSDDNFLTGVLVWDSGGPNYRVRSDAGKLTITGAVNPVGGAKIIEINGPMTVGGSDFGQGDVEFSGAMGDAQTDTLSVTKLGEGTLTLSGANTYTGATTVSGGTLLVNGSTAAGSTVNVDSGGTLGGTGSISGAVNVTGVLSPGASIETLSSGTLTFNNGSTFAYEVDSSVGLGVAADLQKVTGNLNLIGTVTLALDDIATSAAAFELGTTFSLINYTGTWNGGFFTYDGDELANNSQFTAGFNTWQIVYDAAEGGSNFADEYASSSSFVNIITVIPEPAAALLGGIGSLILLRRRRECA